MSKSKKYYVNEPETKDNVIQMPVNTAPEGVIDLDTEVINTKKFRFCKDNDRIIELNLSDMGIMARIAEAYPMLQAQQEEASKLLDGLNIGEDVSTEESIESAVEYGKRLKSIDSKMRELIDFIFNTDVSSKAAPDGSMYDPFNGSFRFEYIITLLINQYGDNLQAEFAKMERQIDKHTNKYVKG